MTTITEWRYGDHGKLATTATTVTTAAMVTTATMASMMEAMAAAKGSGEAGFYCIIQSTACCLQELPK